MGTCHFFIGDIEEPFADSNEYQYLPTLQEDLEGNLFAVMEFESPLYVPPDSIFVASKLDADTSK